MSVNVFIQEHSGDYNGDIEFDTRIQARSFVETTREARGYWFDTDTFIPWHRIDYIKIEEQND